ncbi:MAG: hypothetical protein JO329_02445 [Planctomycetaceae bacterium]|nr:hypothetical protein [Planctomycetaceae bacterium]MBV8316911.1 hypothetical protein [Planctomycetaceae bacterium]
MGDVQDRLVRHQQGEVCGGKRPPMAGVRNTVAGSLKARHLMEVFEIHMSAHAGLPRLTSRFLTAAGRDRQRTLLGKALLFPDQASWSDAEIVRGDRSQHQVGSAFRCLKSPHHVSLRPQRHGTDPKDRVQVFACV